MRSISKLIKYFVIIIVTSLLTGCSIIRRTDVKYLLNQYQALNNEHNSYNISIFKSRVKNIVNKTSYVWTVNAKINGKDVIIYVVEDAGTYESVNIHALMSTYNYNIMKIILDKYDFKSFEIEEKVNNSYSKSNNKNKSTYEIEELNHLSSNFDSNYVLKNSFSNQKEFNEKIDELYEIMSQIYNENLDPIFYVNMKYLKEDNTTYDFANEIVMTLEDITRIKNNYNDYMSNYYENNKDYRSKNNDKKYNEITIKEYPFESDYYDFTTNNRIYLNNNGMSINFFTGVLSNNNSMYISGNISNPKHLKGSVDLNTAYYDINYNEIGNCQTIIELLGKGYSHTDFSCHITKEDIKDNKEFLDTKYYKININSIEIND